MERRRRIEDFMTIVYFRAGDMTRQQEKLSGFLFQKMEDWTGTVPMSWVLE